MNTPVRLFKVLRYAVISLCLITIFVNSASAQLNYTTFSSGDMSDFNFLSDAEINGNALRLIRGQNTGHAAIWHKKKHRVTDGFVTMFTFRIINGTGDTGGADGFAYIIQNSSSVSPGGIGGRGGNIGYGEDTNPQAPSPGISNSIAIEFDTFENAELGDPNNNHISVHNRGQLQNSSNENASIAIAAAIPNIRDGATHTVRIEYDGPTGTTPHQWRIFLDNLTTPIITFVRDLGTVVLTNNGPDAWVGFTAGSAAEWENHDILSWSHSPNFSSNIPGFTAPDADMTGPLSVSSSDYHPGADPQGNNPDAEIDTAVLPDRATEIWAKYYFPDNLNGGPYPLVVLLAGNHGTCGWGTNPRFDNNTRYTREGRCITEPDPSGTPRPYVPAPSHRGYDYLAEKLTSWGYIVASVNPNRGINAGNPYPLSTFSNAARFPEYPEDSNLILTRGRLVLRHIQKLSEWNDGVQHFVTSVSDSRGFHSTGVTGWYGMKIQTEAQPITVRAIGRMYRNGNSGVHPLRIVRANDNMTVAEVSVTMSNSNDGQIKYAELATPVTLAPNTVYYVVSQEVEGGDQFSRAKLTTPNNVARVVGGIRSYNGFTWKNYGGNPLPFVTVSFLYETASSTPTELGVNLKGKIDFSNVGLMGHSRGGEGMRAAYNLYREPANPWTSRIRSSMNVKGIFEFAPTDRFVRNLAGNVTRLLNADGTAWNVVLPACDGDVFQLSGVKPFDRMLKSSSDVPATPKSVYYVYGTNHNYYNTQWQESDSYLNRTTSPPNFNGCIGPDNNPLFTSPVVTGTGFGSPDQQKTGSSPFMAFMRGNVGSSSNPNFNQNFDPRFKVPSNVTSITKVERAFSPSANISRTLILNDLELPLTTNVCMNPTITCSSGVTAISSRVQQRTDVVTTPPIINHDDDFTAANVSWASPNPNRYIQANTSSASVNVSTYQTLDFRISRRRDNMNPQILNSLNNTDITELSVQLVMADGSISDAVSLAKYVKLEGPVGKSNQTTSAGVIPLGELHPILRSVRIPLTDIAETDLTQVRGVRFIFNHTSSGAVNLGNIRFLK